MQAVAVAEQVAALTAQRQTAAEQQVQAVRLARLTEVVVVELHHAQEAAVPMVVRA
jgi:hypothetical protein